MTVVAVDDEVCMYLALIQMQIYLMFVWAEATAAKDCIQLTKISGSGQLLLNYPLGKVPW